MHISQRAREIAARAPHIAIASICPDGTPWNTPVFMVHDEKFVFYWASFKESQHSKNIRSNPDVFLTTFDLSAVPQGLYVRARAEEMSEEEEIRKAFTLLMQQVAEPYWKVEDVRGEGSVRMYKATPKRAWLNGGRKANGRYFDVREELKQ